MADRQLWPQPHLQVLSRSAVVVLVAGGLPPAVNELPIDDRADHVGCSDAAVTITLRALGDGDVAVVLVRRVHLAGGRGEDDAFRVVAGHEVRDDLVGEAVDDEHGAGVPAIELRFLALGDLVRRQLADRHAPVVPVLILDQAVGLGLGRLRPDVDQVLGLVDGDLVRLVHVSVQGQRDEGDHGVGGPVDDRNFPCALAGVIRHAGLAVDADVLAFAVHDDLPDHRLVHRVDVEHERWFRGPRRLHLRPALRSRLGGFCRSARGGDEQVVRVEVESEAFGPATDIEHDLDEVGVARGLDEGHRDGLRTVERAGGVDREVGDVHSDAHLRIHRDLEAAGRSAAGRG